MVNKRGALLQQVVVQQHTLTQMDQPPVNGLVVLVVLHHLTSPQHLVLVYRQVVSPLTLVLLELEHVNLDLQ